MEIIIFLIGLMFGLAFGIQIKNPSDNKGKTIGILLVILGLHFVFNEAIKEGWVLIVLGILNIIR